MQGKCVDMKVKIVAKKVLKLVVNELLIKKE
jgi:hypothetical protein